MKVSLMKRQLQNDYIHKIKQTIQHLILKDSGFLDRAAKSKGGEEEDSRPAWDSPKIREILRQYVPLAEIILDDSFF